MQIVVVKIGSSIIAPKGKVDLKFLSSLAKDIIKTESLGYKVILVSSGAIASGISLMGFNYRPRKLEKLMALAAVGQVGLMELYIKKFKRYDKHCAQVLLTWEDFNQRHRYLNAKKTLHQLLSWGIIPIVNENDAISSEEIKFGDNDRLAALVADLLGAKKIIILSNVEGLYSSQGLITDVNKIDKDILSLARKEDSHFTVGGMVTKLEAAKIAMHSGISFYIAYGRKKEVISRIINGEKIGTYFHPSLPLSKARKRWIAFGRKAQGKIVVDQGAEKALVEKNSSLLAVGIVAVEGNFKAGDSVEVVNQQGQTIGCGISSFSAQEILANKGRKNLPEVIHRNNFFLSGGKL